jgi:hypothetical protein
MSAKRLRRRINMLISKQIISKPYKVNTSSGNWAVRCLLTYTGGMTAEASEYFWRKREAIAWINSFKDKEA